MLNGNNEEGSSREPTALSSWRDEKNHEELGRAAAKADIRTEHLQNTSVLLYRCTNSFGGILLLIESHTVHMSHNYPNFRGARNGFPLLLLLLLLLFLYIVFVLSTVSLVCVRADFVSSLRLFSQHVYK
jgi:hypothetical protein